MLDKIAETEFLRHAGLSRGEHTRESHGTLPSMLFDNVSDSIRWYTESVRSQWQEVQALAGCCGCVRE